MTKPADLPYRPCAGILLINGARQAFVGQRIDTKLEAWQLPQGGIDPGEDDETAALRELEEETGIGRDLVDLVATAPEELFYDVPPEMVGKVWGGRYRGQRQRWFLMRFRGRDDQVNLRTRHPEFRAWRWVDPNELIELAVPFKRQLYIDVLAAFADHLR